MPLSNQFDDIFFRELVELIVSWADEFHKNSLEIIITLPLPLINKFF